MSYKVTIRVGPQASHERVPTLADAVDLLELRLRELGPEARRGTKRAFRRTYEPIAQVAARGEISGPGAGRLGPRLQAGADVRGDGSIEAYRGRVNRQVVELEPGKRPSKACGAYSARRRPTWRCSRSADHRSVAIDQQQRLREAAAHAHGALERGEPRPTRRGGVTS